MKLYICNAPIRFPRSEYGGLLVVMANNKKELGAIITKRFKEDAENCFDLSLSVRSCKELALDPEQDYQPGIVSEFVT